MSEDNPTIIRTQNRHLAPAASETLLFPSWRRFCIVKYNISRSGYLPKCHEMLRLPRKVTLQPHQILRLPRKMNVIIDVRRTWGSHFQCVEQVKSPSNISKYCACHAKWMSTVLLYETSTLRYCNSTDVLLCGSITLQICYFSDVLLYGTSTLRYC